METRSLLSYEDVAKSLGISAATIRAWRARGQFPAPDVDLIEDRPRWYPETIAAWKVTRPGKGNWKKKGTPRRAKPGA